MGVWLDCFVPRHTDGPSCCVPLQEGQLVLYYNGDSITQQRHGFVHVPPLSLSDDELEEAAGVLLRAAAVTEPVLRHGHVIPSPEGPGERLVLREGAVDGEPGHELVGNLYIFPDGRRGLIVTNVAAVGIEDLEGVGALLDERWIDTMHIHQQVVDRRDEIARLNLYITLCNTSVLLSQGSDEHDPGLQNLLLAQINRLAGELGLSPVPPHTALSTAVRPVAERIEAFLPPLPGVPERFTDRPIVGFRPGPGRPEPPSRADLLDDDDFIDEV